MHDVYKKCLGNICINVVVETVTTCALDSHELVVMEYFQLCVIRFTSE
jgi:hypothetical protein